MRKAARGRRSCLNCGWRFGQVQTLKMGEYVCGLIAQQGKRWIAEQVHFPAFPWDHLFQPLPRSREQLGPSVIGLTSFDLPSVFIC